MLFLQRMKKKKGEGKWEKWIEAFLTTLSTNLKKGGAAAGGGEACRQAGEAS